MNDRRAVGGQQGADSATRVLEGGLGTFLGLGAIALVVITIGTDLLMGPVFMYFQANQLNVGLQPFAWVVPLVISLGTTGLQYALLHRSLNRNSKLPLVAAGFVAMLDTLGDSGGVVALITRDERAGQTIFPPGGMDWKTYFMWAVIVILCLTHEMLLGLLLEGYKPLRESGKPGGRAEGNLLWIAGFIYHFVKTNGLYAGAISLFALDFILAPQLSEDTFSLVFWAVFSIAVMAIQMRAWRWYHNVGRDIKGTDEWNAFETWAMIGCFVVGLVDSVVDIMAFNRSIYGQETLIIANPTLAWLIMLLTCLMFVSLNEYFIDNLFLELGVSGKMFSFIGRKGGGGGGDMIDDAMFDAPLPMPDSPVGDPLGPPDGGGGSFS